MKRAAVEAQIAKKRLKLSKILGGSSKMLCPGYYRKKKALDCGKSKCGWCRPEKFPVRVLKQSEKVSQLKLKEIE